MTEESPLQPKADCDPVTCEECNHEVVMIRRNGAYILRCPCGTERSMLSIAPIPSGWTA